MGIASTDFGLTTDQRDKLFANGQAAASKFLVDWAKAHPPVAAPPVRSVRTSTSQRKRASRR
jgi:NTE family protein